MLIALMNDYLFWLVLGFVLMILEVVGFISMSLFVSIGSILTALILLVFFNSDNIAWYYAFLIWSIMCALSFLLLKIIPTDPKESQKNKDINEY